MASTSNTSATRTRYRTAAHPRRSLRAGPGLLQTLEGHSEYLIGAATYVIGVAITADGRRAVSASSDNTLKFWDLDTGRELRTLTGHSDLVNGVAMTSDGRRAVSVSRDETLKVWELESGEPIATFTCDAALECCAFAEDRTIFAGDAGGRVHLLTLEIPAASVRER